MLKSIFNFSALKTLLASNFKILIDCLDGGVYVRVSWLLLIYKEGY